jgi:hypothetical protein
MITSTAPSVISSIGFGYTPTAIIIITSSDSTSFSLSLISRAFAVNVLVLP